MVRGSDNIARLRLYTQFRGAGQMLSRSYPSMFAREKVRERSTAIFFPPHCSALNSGTLESPFASSVLLPLAALHDSSRDEKSADSSPSTQPGLQARGREHQCFGSSSHWANVAEAGSWGSASTLTDARLRGDALDDALRSWNWDRITMLRMFRSVECGASF